MDEIRRTDRIFSTDGFVVRLEDRWSTRLVVLPADGDVAIVSLPDDVGVGWTCLVRIENGMLLFADPFTGDLVPACSDDGPVVLRRERYGFELYVSDGNGILHVVGETPRPSIWERVRRRLFRPKGAEVVRRRPQDRRNGNPCDHDDECVRTVCRRDSSHG